MYQLTIKPTAIKMAMKAYKWYEDHRTGLGELFLAEVDKCYDKLEAIPESYQKIQKNFRQIIVRNFPYVVVFEILNNEVLVYAVFHTSRNPKKKFKK
jgi:plasmid stabilization system protein ParE